MQENGTINLEPETFVSPKTKAFADYWFSLKEITRADKPGAAPHMPVRAAFDPIAIPSLLSDIVLLERTRPDAFLLRLQGTAFIERGVMDRTGTTLSPDETQPGRQQIFNAMTRILNTPCGLRLVGVEQNMDGKNSLVEVAVFPLANNEGKPTFVVALVSTLETLGYREDVHFKDSLVEIREAVEIDLGLA